MIPIDRSQVFSTQLSDAFAHVPTLAAVNVVTRQRSDPHPAQPNSLHPSEPDGVWDTESSRTTGEATTPPAASTSTTVRTKLDKVSDPKLEIKKEATAPNGLYGVNYSLSAPGPGLNNITFPISIDEGLQRKKAGDAGTFFAMQFGVNNQKGAPLARGYIGLQPRGDGKALVVFSGFGPHFKAPQGRAEADGGAGGSNSTLVDFKFGHKYNLTIEVDPTDPHRLKGFIQDVTDPDKPGSKQHVKNLYVDQKVALAGRDTGFVEHYGARINRSSQIGTMSGSFAAPFTVDDKDNVRTGEIRSSGLYGRYKHSMVGNEELTKESGKGKLLHFSFQGVGYQKKD